MATQKQIDANRKNAQSSTGPSEESLAITAFNAYRHGLAVNHPERFTFLEDEKSEKFQELLDKLTTEHKPETETERTLVRHMTESDWLRARAVRLQTKCIDGSTAKFKLEQLPLFIRYQTTHERAYYKALKELQNIRKQSHKEEIGFESQKLKQAAENRAAEALTVKKDAQILKREEFEFKKEVFHAKNEVRPAAENSPGNLKMAA